MVRYFIPETVLVQEVAAETVLMDMDKGAYYELNEMGAVMLKRLRETGDPSQIAKTLIKEFDVSESVLDRDIRKIILDLERNGLIQRDPSSVEN